MTPEVFAESEFGSVSYDDVSGGAGAGKIIACLGDSSDHGGFIIESNQSNNRFILVNDKPASSTSTAADMYAAFGFGDIGEGASSLGVPFAVAGDKRAHWCPIPGHGTTLISPVTVKTFYVEGGAPGSQVGGGEQYGSEMFASDGSGEISNEGGKLIITVEAVAGCGARIRPPSNRKVFVE